MPNERNLSGWLPDRPDHRDRILLPMRGALQVPSAADVSQYCNPPPDQATIGSCVANSSTSALEWLYRKEQKAPVDFSRLYVYYYARQYGGFPTSQDTGCYIRDAIKVLAKQGTCYEQTWPYSINQYKTKPPVNADTEAANHQALYYFRCMDLTAIKTSIGIDGFPVVIGFSVPDSIYSAETESTGIVRYPTSGTRIIGGHAVIAVGYDVNTRLVKFQNSWGTGWGSSGYGFLPFEFFETGLADDFWTVRTVEMIDYPPPPPPPRPRPRPQPRRRVVVRRRRRWR
jgi:Cysteine protease